MTEPKFALSTDSGRYYVLPVGTFRSVTSVLSVISKPMLVKWASKASAEKAMELFESGEFAKDPSEAFRLIKSAPDEIRMMAADAGSRIHKAFEEYMLNGLEPDGEDEKVAIDALVSFLESEGYSVVESEVTVFNTTHRYAGTLDMILERDGSYTIADIKTGGVYDEAAMQLSAYMRADGIIRNSGDIEEFPYEIEKGIILSVKDGKVKAYDCDVSDKVFDAFVHALRLSDALIEIKGAVRARK